VFLSVMKELPITYILSPLNFQPLSLKVWGHVNEAQFIDAAPYALTILLLSAAFVGLLLMRGHEDAT
jgi:iron(III) transport system permease protein